MGGHNITLRNVVPKFRRPGVVKCPKSLKFYVVEIEQYYPIEYLNQKQSLF